MTLLSSNSTLLYRLFLPMFFTIFMGATCIAAWTDEDGGILSDTLPPHVGNIVWTLLFSIWLWIVIRKMWSLRRVEVDTENLYVSNYWHTAKYGLEDIEALTQRKTLWLPMATIRLRGKGRFGRDIRFIKGRDARSFLEGFTPKSLA